jgi:hypothetical protein
MALRFFTLVLLMPLIFTPTPLAAIDVELIETVPIRLEFERIEKVGGFFVTDDGLVVVSDEWAGDLKVMERSGEHLKLLRIIGERGYGPGEFISPYNCNYEKKSRRFVVADWGAKKIFLYNRVGRTGFERDDVEVPCPHGAFDLQLKANTLYVAGHRILEDQRRYALYSVDLGQVGRNGSSSRASEKFLVSSKKMYQMDDYPNFTIQYSDQFIPVIGMNHYFDIHNEDAYIVWMGDLKIIKLGIESDQKSRKVFGKKTGNYVKPYPSRRLIDSYRSGNRDLYLEELKNMSLVWKVIAASRHVLLIYEGPELFTEENKSNFWLQFYTMDGTFKGEKQLAGKPSRRLYFDRGNNTLYSISGDLAGGELSLLKYRIVEQ